MCGVYVLSHALKRQRAFGKRAAKRETKRERERERDLKLGLQLRHQTSFYDYIKSRSAVSKLALVSSFGFPLFVVVASGLLFFFLLLLR